MTPDDRIRLGRDLWGGEVHSSAGIDELAAFTAAKVGGEADDGRWRGTAAQTPGLGWEAPLPQPPSSAGGLGTPGLTYPVTGEGYEVGPAPQPRQVKSVLGQLVSGAQPSYGGPEVSGQHFGYGPQFPQPRGVSDLGDGRLLFEGRSAGPYVVAATLPARPGLLARLAARLRRR